MTNKPLTLGSLFDGSGGFPLGGLLAEITPIWVSEIEPFSIRVTTKHLIFIKHDCVVCTVLRRINLHRSPQLSLAIRGVQSEYVTTKKQGGH